jgi:hypothetical protein
MHVSLSKHAAPLAQLIYDLRQQEYTLLLMFGRCAAALCCAMLCPAAA